MYNEKNQIEFDHDYSKFRITEDKKGYFLVGVSATHIDRLLVAGDFIFYDTRYYEKMEVKYKNFDLKEYLKESKGRCIVLTLFHHRTKKIITTIIKYTEEKHDYFKDRIGEEFEFVILKD